MTGGIITAAVRHLMAAGVQGEALLAAIADMEAALTVETRSIEDGAANDRRRRDREYQAEKRRQSRQSRQISADSADAPPNDNISNPPVPSSNEDGAAEEIEISPETVFWNTGKAFLIRHGIPKTRASSALGKWKRDRGIAATVEALSAAETESRMSGGLVDPIGFIEGVFRNKDPTRARLGVPC